MRAKKDILCHILHGILAGFTTALFNWLGLAVAVFLFIQFTAYEMAEERKIQDELYMELKEWSIGYAISFTIGVVLKCVGILSF